MLFEYELNAGNVKTRCWMVVLLLFTAILIANVFMIVQRYLRHDVTVKIAMNHVTNMTFPAIAFCNMCPLRRTSGGQDNDC